VLFCDLDDFKVVNDQRGHDAGDALLRQVAHRLLDCVRLTDTVARLGGDEFAILLDDPSDSMQVADRIVAATREPVEIEGKEVGTSISVGIAHYEGAAAPRSARGASPRRAPPPYPRALPGGDGLRRRARVHRAAAPEASGHRDVRGEGFGQEPSRQGTRGAGATPLPV